MSQTERSPPSRCGPTHWRNQTASTASVALAAGDMATSKPRRLPKAGTPSGRNSKCCGRPGRLTLAGVDVVPTADGIPEGDEGELIQGVKTWDL